MGLWPFSSGPSTPPPPKTSDGGFVAPDRSTRELCYEARDNFFDCLDQHDIVDAIKEDDAARAKCGREVQAYERDCARTWIKYFKEKRVMEHKRDLTIERIKKEDAETVAKIKAEKQKGLRS